MTDPDLNNAILLAYKVELLEKQVEDLKHDLEKIRQERIDDERKRLRSGVGALGTVILALGGAIWWLLPPSLQHLWDMIRGQR